MNSATDITTRSEAKDFNEINIKLVQVDYLTVQVCNERPEQAFDLFGPPIVSSPQIIKWIAAWMENTNQKIMPK